jgi:glycerol kinase
MLPTVCDSAHAFGETQSHLFGSPIPITGILGDQQAATVGQCCFKPGTIKSTYGTGCFMLLNTGEQKVTSQHRLLTTVAYRINQQTTYALEGSIFMGGSIVQWLRDGLGLIETADESEYVAASVPDTAGVILVPAFVGLGAPYWDPDARGLIIGLTRKAGRAHLVRAGLEAIAHQVTDISEIMNNSGVEISTMHVDGGATQNNLLMQIQADLANCEVVRPLNIETTAMGAAMLAGLEVGYWQDFHELRLICKPDRTR